MSDGMLIPYSFSCTVGTHLFVLKNFLKRKRGSDQLESQTSIIWLKSAGWNKSQQQTGYT